MSAFHQLRSWGAPLHSLLKHSHATPWIRCQLSCPVAFMAALGQAGRVNAQHVTRVLEAQGSRSRNVGLAVFCCNAGVSTGAGFGRPLVGLELLGKFPHRGPPRGMPTRPLCETGDVGFVLHVAGRLRLCDRDFVNRAGPQATSRNQSPHPEGGVDGPESFESACLHRALQCACYLPPFVRGTPSTNSPGGPWGAAVRSARIGTPCPWIPQLQIQMVAF